MDHEEPVREWQAAPMLATRARGRLSDRRQSRVARVHRQAVQDLILKQKPIEQACADADKALDALIAQK